MTEKKTYDSGVARMAGNIAAGLLTLMRSGDLAAQCDRHVVAEYAVDLARLIVAEVQRTEPSQEEP